MTLHHSNISRKPCFLRPERCQMPFSLIFDTRVRKNGQFQESHGNFAFPVWTSVTNNTPNNEINGHRNFSEPGQNCSSDLYWAESVYSFFHSLLSMLPIYLNSIAGSRVSITMEPRHHLIAHLISSVVLSFTIQVVSKHVDDSLPPWNNAIQNGLTQATPSTRSLQLARLANLLHNSCRYSHHQPEMCASSYSHPTTRLEVCQMIWKRRRFLAST